MVTVVVVCVPVGMISEGLNVFYCDRLMGVD